MRLTTRLAAGALLAALVAVPTAAEAKPASAKVRAQAVAADKSLDRVVSLAKRNRDAAAGKELRNYRRQLRGADTQLRRLRKSASISTSAGAATTYARSGRVVGSVANQCAEQLATLVDDVGGDAQVAIANAIKACIVTRDRIVDVLTGLLEKVPEEAKPYIAKVISMLSAPSEDQIAGITDALGTGTLPVDVSSILTSALEIATAAIDDTIAALQPILGMLPAPVAGIVQNVLTMVTDQLHMVTGMIGNLFTNLFGGVPTGTGTGTGSTGGLGGLFGSGGLPGLNVLQGMFGNGFPFNLIPMNLPVEIPGFSFATR
jgi:hypothetical protein